MTIEFTDKELDVISKSIMPVGATKEDFNFFIAQAKRTGLDPLKRQIWATMRTQKDGTKKIIVGISIDGFRSLAERTGKYGGQIGPFFYDNEGNESQVWLSDKSPAAVKIGIIRTDWSQPLWHVGRPNSFAPDNPPFGSPWLKMREWMTAKCIESAGLRRAFPDVFGGLYGEEELGLEPKQVEPGEVSVLQHEGEQAVSASADKAVPIEGSKTRGKPKQAAKVVEGVEPDSAQGREAVSSEVAQLREQARQVVAEIKEEHRSEASTDDSAGDSPVDVEVTTGDTKLTAPEPLATVDDIMGVLHIGKLNGYSEGEIEAFAAKHFGITEEVDPLTVLTKTQVAQWKHAFSKKAVTA